MATRKQSRGGESIVASCGDRSSLTPTFILPTLLTLLLPLALLVPALLVLPILSLASIGCAGFIALWACAVPKSNPDCVSLWDVSGACALIGFAASIFSEPEHVMEFWLVSGPPQQGR
jgi:hypothetical protein